jgi:rubrerythrin
MVIIADMTLAERLNLRYVRKLFSTPEGRAHVLAQAADGESSGESAIFTQLLAHVDDPELQKVIKKHREDELRHEQLFRARLAAQNAKYELVEELRLVPRIDEEAGGVVDRPIRDARGVLEAYCFLQALEERACFSFELFIRGMQGNDDESAKVIAQILDDERRHLKYCVAVAKKYARSEEERLEVLNKMRAAENRAFWRNQLLNMEYTLSRGLVGGRIETMLWQTVRKLARNVGKPVATPLARSERTSGRRFATA